MKTNRLVFGLLLLVSMKIYGQSKVENRQFTESFDRDRSTFLTTGRNTFCVLEPGYQLILQGVEGKDTVTLDITVLNETKVINNIETRIVVEHESINNNTVEISRNYYAFSKETGSVFYFGEDVDNYKGGTIIDHDGSWIAEGNNKSGILMPGLCLLGARYYQEIAPGVAMDRAEIISLDETIQTPLKTFNHCLKTEETTALHPGEKEYKIFAPGVGLVKDGDLRLVKYGFK